MDNKQYISIIEQALNGACLKGVFSLQDAELISISFKNFVNDYRSLERELELKKQESVDNAWKEFTDNTKVAIKDNSKTK